MGIAIMALALAMTQQHGRVPSIVTNVRSGTIQPGRMRNASAIGDPDKWFGPADYPATSRRARRTGEAVVTVKVGTDDQIVGCAAEGSADAAMKAAACAAIRGRGRFLHGLDTSAHPVVGDVEIDIEWDLTEPPKPGQIFYPPAIVMVPGPPPAASPLADAAVRVQKGLDAIALADRAQWEAAAPVGRTGEARVGIELRPQPGEVPACKVTSSSGDAALDIATCTAATSGRLAPIVQRLKFGFLPITVEWSGRSARLIMPTYRNPQAPELADPADLQPGDVPAGAILSGFGLFVFDVDASGVATNCRIENSFGSDLADLAYCTRLTTGARFKPATDSFGYPKPGRGSVWVDSPPRRRR